MTSKLKYPFDPIEFPKLDSTRSGVQIQEIIANRIIGKIPAGHAIESIEVVSSTRSETGEAYLLIKTRRIDDDK